MYDLFYYKSLVNNELLNKDELIQPYFSNIILLLTSPLRNKNKQYKKAMENAKKLKMYLEEEFDIDTIQ